jgi:hypothetical protein
MGNATDVRESFQTTLSAEPGKLAGDAIVRIFGEIWIKFIQSINKIGAYID